MRLLLTIFFCLFTLATTTAQKTTVYKVAVLVPLYIDSAFDGNNLKPFTASTLPKSMLPGLDFYNGVMLAIDSLNKQNHQLEIAIFDSKMPKENFNQLLQDKYWDSVSLIIASFRDRNEIKDWATLCATKEIPLVSATFPNDGGVTDNPYYIQLNPTLYTHCNGIFKYIQKNYSTQNIVFITRKGRMEDDIANYFNQLNKSTAGVTLKYKTVQLIDTFNTKQLQQVLDSTKNNLVICGSLHENFGIRLFKQLSALKKFKTVVVGMPTWDGIKDFNKLPMDENAKNGVEIIYSTPYHFSRNNILSKQLIKNYNAKFYARASDWFLKGYETTVYFCNILSSSKGRFLDNLNNNKYYVFNSFDIQPNVYANSLNYYENKNLYFIKKQDGVVKSVTQ